MISVCFWMNRNVIKWTILSMSLQNVYCTFWEYFARNGDWLLHWLIVSCCSSRSRIFRSFRDVTIDGKGQKILHLKFLSTEGSLSCHTFWLHDMEPRFSSLNPKDPLFVLSITITKRFGYLFLPGSRRGIIWRFFVWLFVLGILVPFENCLLICRRRHCRLRTANFDLCSAVMATEQWEFFSMTH